MNRTAKNTAVYFAGTVVMGVFGFINTMLLTRVLDEQVYAMYGLLHNFVTAVTMFICLGYDTAYTRFYYQHNQTHKHFLMKVMVVPSVLFVMLAVALAEPGQFVIRYIFGERLSATAVLLLLAYVFFYFAHRFTQLTARMEERAVNYVFSNFVSRFGFVVFVFVVFLLWRHVSFDWVLISCLLGGALGTLINVWLLLRLSSSSNADGSSITHREMLAYGFPHMLNSVLVLVIPLIEKLIIRDLAGWEILSIYTAAAVFQTVVLILTNTVYNIWNPMVFKHCDNPQTFKPILHNFGMVITAITTVGFALCVLLRRWLVLILDKNYFDVYIIAPAICFGACFSLVTVIYSSGINIVKKTIHQVIEPLIQITISLAGCFLLIKPLGLVGVGASVLLSIMISRLYKVIVGLRLYDTGVSEHKMLLLTGVCTVVAFASLFLTDFICDAVMFAVLIAATILIMNKDIKTVVQTMTTIFLSKKKKEKD